jgi:hypothetical protein
MHGRLLYNGGWMSVEHEIRVLVIRSWLLPVAELRTALLDARIHARIERVDIEPALHAALTRTQFDVAIYDGETPGLSYATVVKCMRDGGYELPIVELGDAGTIGQRVLLVLAARSN